MEGSMKCAVYRGVKNIVIEERPIPQITAKDALVKILRAGICGSDVNTYKYGGERSGFYPGAQMGHEMVGRVVEKGADVKDDIQIGDIVFIDPILCQKGGVAGSSMAGAFSEYVLVQDAALNVNLYNLGKDVDLDSAAIIEPLSVGTQGAVMMDPKKDDKVVVLGAGAIGLSAAASLIARGLKNVVVVDQNAQRLLKAEALGAKTVNTTVDTLKEKLIEYLGEFPGYMPVPDVDLYIDAAGAAPLLRECFSYSKEKTKYGIIAVYSEITLDGIVFVASQPVIYGSRGYTHETIVEVIDHIINKKPDIGTMVTKKYRHEDFPEAIAEAASGNQIKVLIDYEMK